jgi:para-nitrobenzyl esterase
MKKIALACLLAAVLIGGFFWATRTTEETFVPVPDSATLRQTTSGALLGYAGAEGAWIWRGVRYAKAPTGTLRWRGPVPAKPPRKGGIIEVLNAGASCPQLPSPLSGEAAPGRITVGSEDCLFLDIYAPPDTKAAPVMVWLHGGGNSIGTGSSYSGENLAMKHGVVVVSINYRLGLFGWFSHPSLSTGSAKDDSGNFGTLDVIQALKWVKTNITQFGGDPDNVTVFGESAGGFNTLAMMASPLAKGLFHRAIVQSGGFETIPLSEAQDAVSEGGHAFSSAEIVSKLLVADGTVSDLNAARDYASDMSRTRLRQYLYGKTPDELYAFFNDFGFGMVDFPNHFRDGVVLPMSDPRAIFSSADTHNLVPVILGTNRDEPSLFMVRDERYVDYWLGFLPRLKDPQAYKQIVKYGALAWKERGVDALARAMTTAGNANVYTYRFDWDEEPSQLGFDLSTALGAAHGLEIAFAFNHFKGGLGLSYIYPGDAPQFALADSMSSYWTAFATSGDPARGQDGQQVPWLAWGSEGKRSLILDSPADQGIFMDDTEVTLASIKQSLATDPDFTDDTLRCQIYATNFRGEQFDRSEYDALGGGLCRDLDPESMRFF